MVIVSFSPNEADNNIYSTGFQYFLVYVGKLVDPFKISERSVVH
jgi:hypothetical protein